MAPDTTRKAVNLAAADARRAIEALQEQSISLQCELAEARAEIESLKSRASLTPITDPTVRGVLVDDGEPTSVVSCHRLYLDESDGHLWQPKHTGECNTKWQPVKLRPASEFGVPGEPIPVQVHSKLEALAESLGIKDWQAAGTSTLATLIAEAVDKLKSTPAEPVQKLVPLPEGVVVLVKREGRSPVVGEYINVNGNLCFVDKHWRGETSDEIWTPLDPALYGVDAERVRELEAEQVDCMACGRGLGYHGAICGECKSDELQLGHFVKEAERLRKAIETHRHKNTGMACDHKQSDLELWSALTPPTAATGEAECPCDIERGCAKGDGVRVEGKCTLELKGRSVAPPSAPAAESEGGGA